MSRSVYAVCVAAFLVVSACSSDTQSPDAPSRSIPPSSRVNAPPAPTMPAANGTAPTLDWMCVAASERQGPFGSVQPAACAPGVAPLRFSTASVHASTATTPDNLSSAVTGSTVSLQWRASAGAVSYIVEAGSAPGLANLANFDTGSSVPALVANNVGVGTYYVRIRARAPDGVSAASAEVIVTVGNGSCAPNAPGNLSVSSAGASVTLRWTAPAGCTPSAYRIQAGSAPGLSDLADFATADAATVFTASSVAAGTYYVRVRATTAAGTSGASNEAVLQVGGGGCTTTPAAPLGLTASATGSTVVLSWSPGPSTCAATSYTIQAGSSPGLSNLANFATGSSATTYTSGGVGNGTYYVRVRASNARGESAASNEATLVVGPRVDACTYALSSSTQTIVAAGGASSVAVTAGCSWSAASDSSWLVITSGGSGSGPGAIAFSAAANTSTTPRSARITVSGIGGATQLVVTQNGVITPVTPVTPCALSLSATSQLVSATASTGSVAVTSTCSWSATSDSPWLTITSGASSASNGTIVFATTANPSPGGRTGRITVTSAGGSVQFIVTQGVTDCMLTVSPTSVAATPTAGTYQVAVTSGCPWTASSDASWISFVSPSGSGSGTLMLSVAANTGTSARTGKVTISGAGGSVVVNVTQGAPLTASLSITPSDRCTVDTFNDVYRIDSQYCKVDASASSPQGQITRYELRYGTNSGGAYTASTDPQFANCNVLFPPSTVGLHQLTVYLTVYGANGATATTSQVVTFNVISLVTEGAGNVSFCRP